jgi:2,3-bisphosphoglycerate-dependent phosphoglycerate mutase
MGYLILVRHGKSDLKLGDRFVGWMDVPLSRKGLEEALDCAVKLENIELDLAFVSKLVRAQETLLVILSGQKKTGILVHEKTHYDSSIGEIEWYSYPEKLNKSLIPVYATAALNERYYGKLQGKKKQKMEEKYGTEKLTSWDFDFEPGLLEGESLKVVYERAVPYFKKEVLPAIKKGKNVIVCAHHSSLRALVKYIEDISDKNIENVRFSTGEIVRYNFSKGRLVKENAEIPLKQK